MKKILLLICLPLLIICFFPGCHLFSDKPRILVFTKTAGYHHESIAAGVQAIFKLGTENNFDVDTTSDATMFTDDTLKKFAAVVFLNTTDTSDVLMNSYEETDFQRYIEAGGGFVGVHAATDAGYHWGWYKRLVGASFNGHPEQQQATINVADADNISTKHLPKKWSRFDEWYNFKNFNKDVHVLLTIDEGSYKGGTMNGNHPMAWYHDYDGGRAWYTELGHTDESYSDQAYLLHLLGGIKYAIGDNEALNYARVKTEHVPDEDRFTKTQLVTGTFYEPTEITVLPNLDVLIAQRRGEIMLYKNEDHTVEQAGFLNAYFLASVSGVNAEEGVLGIQKDPDFSKNHYIYIYYSPADTSVNRLSRFTFTNDTIDNASEKIILQLYSQRNICCHTGGSIAFGKDRMLYLSTGDNSTPFDEPGQRFVSHGYAPLNDAPGHVQYDSRRSAGNTNDLRGKILRIRVAEDGTYDIPDGNLFAKGGDRTMPEIYVMGDRNPYRVSVDQKNGYVYWGEVGPDANIDSLTTRGPRGYDEVNQARKPGFFGWPLFIANNIPYHSYDYTTGQSGTAFNAEKPENNSRNNTGLTMLPPAQPAFIWYPYGDSKDFPQVGSGGRTAMAGPVYYADMFPKETRFPDYYNGKLFIYEWIRGWIKVVTMQPNGDFDNMEPFMEHTKLNNPSDMEVGPDGKLYIVEYGSGWFAKNPDAGLVRIDYNASNRPPKIASIDVDKTSGSLPLKITATVAARDPDNDALSYKWDLGNGTTVITKEPTLHTTLSSASDYAISVEVSDDKKAAAKSNSINVYAGNMAPTVDVQIKGNQTFYFPGQDVRYHVAIDDKDDTAKAKDLNDLIVSASYEEGTDKAGTPQGHQVLTEAMIGKNLMLSLDCKACHKVDEKSVGPSFTAVSQRYQKDANAMTYLAQKVIKGGGGVWGDAVMSAHPNLKESDAKQIITWVMSLASVNTKIKSLPADGSINATMNKPVKDNGILYINAVYTDKGGNNIKPLTGTATKGLRNNKLSFEGISRMEGFNKGTFNGITYLQLPKANGWFRIDSIDLLTISSIAINTAWSQQPVAAYTLELHLDAPDGKKIAQYNFSATNAPVADNNPHTKLLTAKLDAVNDGKLHNVYVVSKATAAPETKELVTTYIAFYNK